MDITLEGCTVLPMDDDRIIEDGAIAIKDRRIVFVGKNTLSNITAEEKINAKGKVAIPGLVNLHTHVPMTLLRGIAEDLPLDVWLKKTIWPIEWKLRPEDVHVGALLGCLEMIKSGTTCFADMYFNEDKVAKAVEESGLRAVLAEGIIETENKALCKAILERSVTFAKSFRDRAHGRIGTMLAPHSAYSCGRELLTEIAEKAAQLDLGIHIHLAESRRQFARLQRKYRCGEVEFLDKIGFLKDNVVAAHCIDLSAKDRLILAKRGINVAYVPVSNMKLGLGVARAKDLIDLGINVGLGTDGAACNNTLDMFETMKIAALMQKLVCGDPVFMSAFQTLKIATVCGAKALGLENEIGTLEVGKKADIVLIDFSKPHLKPLHDVCASIVYSAKGSDVDTVIVDGRILMEKRHVKTLKEQQVMIEAEETASALLSR